MREGTSVSKKPKNRQIDRRNNCLTDSNFYFLKFDVNLHFSLVFVPLSSIPNFFLLLFLAGLGTGGRRGRFGKIQTFTVPQNTRYLIKAWELGEEHIHTIMDTFQEHIMVEREHLKKGSSH